MSAQTQPQFRHILRPLSVFGFCGQQIAEPRGEYIWTTRNLPLCPDCERVRTGTARPLGAKYRPARAIRANAAPAAQ